MTPQEVALKLASASGSCGTGRCPYSAECKGTTETCKMKEVAMIIRTIFAELETATARLRMMEGFVQYLTDYVTDLEDVNAQYHRLAVAFQNGYRARKKIAKKAPRKIKKRPKIDPVLMDGDPRYEQEEKKEVQKLPVVVI